MAEVPLPTPTKVPVPSTDIRNAVFAGAKLDEEVTGTGDFYTDRLDVKRLTNTGRNNQFNAAQQERADQFQQFLLSSGYVFLGDYEDGPFQFSARNQYIRYDNQYYRLNATTDIGFTTTGTDATSFANDVTHFVLMDGDTLRSNLGSGEGFKYIGQVRSVAVLALLPGSDGDRVLVSGYYAGSNLGGGEFYYDSSKSDINNGVTIFNGWVRIVKNKTLTTYDAGMVPGDGSNATAKMRALANALEDGYTLLGFGKHLTNDNVIFDGKSGITVANGGDFCISAKELRDSWVHHGWTGNELPDAVLYARFCPGFKAIGLKVVGAKSWYSGYAPEQTYEMGDAGIRLHHCPDSVVEKCDISHVFTWLLYSEYGNNNIARFNTLSDCTRQSGINITAYSSNVKIYGNTISDAALYAIEMENFPEVASPVPTQYAFCGYNIIRRCGRAIAVVGNIIEADIVGNVAYDSYGGIFTRTGAYSKNINIEDNTLKNCQNSYEITSSSNVFVNGGEVSAYNDPQWLYTSQYDAIMKWGDGRSKFYTHGWTPLAQAFILGNVTSLVVWINGVQYTAISGTRDDSVTLGTNGSISYSCLITLNAALPETIELYTSVGYILTTSSFANITKGIYTRQYNSSYPLNNNVRFSGVTIRGVYNAIHTLEVYADNSTIRQSFMRMVMENCTYWARGGGNGIYFEGNLPAKGCLSAFTQGVPNLIPSRPPIRVSDVKTKSTTDALRNRPFTTYTSGTCTGFFLNIVDGGNAGPSNIIIRMNGAVWYTIPASMWNAAGVFNITFNTNISAAEGQYISVENANGNLSYTSYELSIAMM